ncbi:MAG: BatD family protein, partial [Candidatus Polarisedimenticolia bacterium]
MSRAHARRVLRPAAALLLAALASSAALAQEASVRARVDRSRVHEGEEVALIVEVAAPSLDRLGPPDLSRLQDFDVVGGPSRSHSFQWINGRTSSTMTFTYALRPRGAGVKRIPSLGVLVQGRTYRTGTIDVEVVPGPPPVVPVPGTGQPAAPGPGRGQPGRPPGVPRPAGGPVVRLRAELDQRTAYVGQQVTLKVVLDTQTEVLNLGLKDTPTFPGFWAEDMKLPENLDLKRVQIGGDVFHEYTLMKKALFPTNDGALTVPAMTWQVQVRRRSADPIESFFFTPTETLTRRTDPVSVRVEPLPAAGRPAGFSGAVGRFAIGAAADRKEAKVNDAIGLKIRVSGEGNLSAVNALPLGILSDFKQYAPKVASSTSFAGDRLRSERVWDHVLIPLSPGTLTIPPVPFSFFDPGEAAYRTVATAPIAVVVTRGAAGETAGPAVTQRDIRALRRDIHYIKPAGGVLRDRSSHFYRSPLFLVLLALPVAADVGDRSNDGVRVNANQLRCKVIGEGGN